MRIIGAGLFLVELDDAHRALNTGAVYVKATAGRVNKVDVLVMADEAIDMVVPDKHAQYVALFRDCVKFAGVDVWNGRVFAHETAFVHHVRV